MKLHKRHTVVALLITVGLSLFAAATTAQEDMTVPDLSAPDEHMQQMNWFIGDWDVVSRYKQENGEWLEENVTSFNSYIIGGNVIFEHFIGPLFNEPFEAWSLRKYNVNTEKWEQRWVDNTAGGFANWTGTWDEATQEFIGYANRSFNEDGTLKETAVREVFFNIEEDRFQWRYEQSSDTGQTWEITWTLDYTRMPK